MGATLAAFSFSINQAAASCKYVTFLDTMLVLQLISGNESRTICDQIIARQPGSIVEAYEITFSKEYTGFNEHGEGTGNANMQIGFYLPLSARIIDLKVRNAFVW